MTGDWWKAATLWSAASLARPIRAWPLRRPCVVANTLRAERTKRLEGRPHYKVAAI